MHSQVVQHVEDMICDVAPASHARNICVIEVDNGDSRRCNPLRTIRLVEHIWITHCRGEVALIDETGQVFVHGLDVCLAAEGVCRIGIRLEFRVVR